MKGKLVLVLSLFVLFSFLLHVVRAEPVDVKATNGYPIHNLDTGLNYTTIQEAIDDNETLDGHTIFVEEGTYYEHMIVNKGVSLVGENRTATIIDGNETGDVVQISADNVSMTGFTVRNSGGVLNCGIKFSHVNGVNISANDIVHNQRNICLYYSSNNSISENTIRGGFGSCSIRLGHSSNNTIFGNKIVNGDIWLNNFSNDNIISKNNATNSQYGLIIGDSHSNIVIKNNLLSNQFDGVAISGNSKNNIICNNRIAYNNVGIRFHGPANNNIVFHNNFIGNHKHTNLTYYHGDPYDNLWDNGYPSGGNYWSNYNGTDFNGGPYQNDTGSDGICDTPFIIDENNTDDYPLMGMFYGFEVYLPPTGGSEYVNVISNSTVENLRLVVLISPPNQYSQPDQEFLLFYVSGEDETSGFCRIMIPRTVLNSSSYIVLVDWNLVDVTELQVSNSTHAYLYFTYQHSRHEVKIIPEFPPLIILPLFMIATLLTVTIHKRKST